jgi:hypothetical protein
VVLQEELGPLPVAGSIFESDLHEAKGTSELLHDRTLDVGVISASKVLIAYGHLYGVADSLAGPGAIFAPWTLLRTVVEALGFGLWIVQGGSLDARVQRTMTERLHGIYQNRKLGNDANIPDLVDHADERIAAVRADSERLGYAFEYPERKAPYVGSQRESAVTAVGRLFNSNEIGALIYRRTSGYVHGTMDAVVSHLGNAEDGVGPGDLRQQQPQTTANDMARVTWYSVVAAVSGLSPIFEYLGYAGDSWKEIGALAWKGAKTLAAEVGLDVPQATAGN